jgi:hypothetical protein
MFLRKLRWMGACVLALGATLAGPSVSRADISIVVNEVDSTGAVVGMLGTFNSPAGASNFTISNTPTSIFNISSLNTELASDGTFGSLSTSFTLAISQSYDQTAGHGLQFVITATGATNNFAGQPGSFTNNAAATSGIAGSGGLDNIAGVNQVTANTTVEGVTTGDSVDARGDGSVSFPPATTTNGNVANLPNPYSITQTITVLASPVNPGAVITKGTTFGGGASSAVTANAATVPAPGGLALALVALPILGFRRMRGKKTVA